MRYCAIASGSNGNCYYVGSSEGGILIDVGISCKQIERRMANVGVLPNAIQGIFVSHEHSDHIRGVSVFARRYQVPVYITEGTYRASRLNLPEALLKFIQPDDEVVLNSLKIQSFSKQHDAAEPCSFLISKGQNKIAVITDVGTACENVIKAVQSAEILFLESNYDEEMLENGPYPYFLKRRIAGSHGHLSNKSSLQLFHTHGSPRLKHLILSHLSAKNNTEQKVYDTFLPYCGTQIRLDVASRERETELFYINSISNKSAM